MTAATRLWPYGAGLAARSLGVSAVAGLVVLAVRADRGAPGATWWSIGLDVGLGLLFVVGAAWAPGPLVQRALFVAVGATWLIASFEPAARLLHQAVLVIALVAFPAGRLHGVMRWLVAALAVPIGLLLFTQLGVAVVFALVAGTALATVRSDPAAATFPAGAAAGVAAVLAVSWSAARFDRPALDSTDALLAYELVLVMVAIGYPLAARAVGANRAELADRLLGDEGLVGLDGLSAVLGRALGDPDLRLYRWQGNEAGYVDGRGHRAVGEVGDRRWLHVTDGSTPLAAVEHGSSALDDPPTAAAVSAAVGLSVHNVQLHEQLQSQLDDLEAARRRLVAAADRQRAATAARLRGEIVMPLRHAISELQRVTVTGVGEEAAQALEVVVQEVTAATEEIAALVAGVPPVELGRGRLAEVVEALARRSPVPVTVMASSTAASDPDTEATLFYVCSEAVTNAVKHARATRVDIAIRRLDDAVVVTVADDGCGGADPSGSGLQGLADRLAARDGRLRVDSPPGAGTTVTATIPVSRSSATA
jgi:signal transduction histidine kinase